MNDSEVTLGEIYRSTQRIEVKVNTLVQEHKDTRERTLVNEERLGHVEHDLRNLKNNEALRAKVEATKIESPHSTIDWTKIIIAVISLYGTIVTLVLTYVLKGTP